MLHHFNFQGSASARKRLRKRIVNTSKKPTTQQTNLAKESELVYYRSIGSALSYVKKIKQNYISIFTLPPPINNFAMLDKAILDLINS
jgi:hypothetical protein